MEYRQTQLDGSVQYLKERTDDIVPRDLVIASQALFPNIGCSQYVHEMSSVQTSAITSKSVAGLLDCLQVI